LNDVLSYIDSMNHGVVPIVGSGKQFKSGTMYQLLSALPSLRNRKKAFFKFPAVRELFPSFMRGYPVDNLWDVEPDSILVIEDANRVFPSRSSSKVADLQEFLGVISHKDILIFLTVQNTSNTDMAFFRDQDILFLHKRMSPVGIQYEREELQHHCSVGNIIIENTAIKEGVNPLFVTYVPRFASTIILDEPPDWYGYAQSHALRDYDPRDVV